MVFDEVGRENLSVEKGEGNRMLWHKRRATSEMGRNIMSGRSQRMTFEIRHSENLEPSRLARPASLAQLSCASRYCAILLIVTLALAGFHC